MNVKSTRLMWEKVKYKKCERSVSGRDNEGRRENKRFFRVGKWKNHFSIERRNKISHERSVPRTKGKLAPKKKRESLIEDDMRNKGNSVVV